MTSMKMEAETIDEFDEENFLFAMQLSSVSIVPVVLKVAIELNLFDIIGKAGPGGHMSAKGIAVHLATQNPNAESMIDRMLRLLASHSVLTSSLVTDEDGLVQTAYGLAPVCKFFVPNKDGVSMAPFVLMNQDKVFTDSLCHLKDAILEGGIPFNMAHNGMNLYEYYETEIRFKKVFHSAMFNYTTIFAKKMVDTFKGFKDMKELVDVGGGTGSTISIITSKYPTIKGINFDLPHVIEHARPYAGVQHIGGSMFENIPKGETIFMKCILHNWSDDNCKIILKNCYKALPDHGKVIIVEIVVPVTSETNIAAKSRCQTDINMMLQNPGGKERTEEEFFTLAQEAGFASMKKVCCIYNLWLIEFYKK